MTACCFLLLLYCTVNEKFNGAEKEHKKKICVRHMQSKALSHENQSINQSTPQTNIYLLVLYS
jgi:hypothetical protein